MKARYENYLSNQTIKATAEATVSRKAVLSGAFGLVKKGAQIAASSRGNLYIGGALLAYEAYQAVKSPIESAGYKYDEKSEEFLKYWDNKLCIWDRRGDYPNEIYKEYECTGVDSSIIRAYKLGGKSRSEAEFLMKSKMEAMANNYWTDRRQYLVDRGNSEYLKYNVSECIFSLNGGSCSVSNGSDSRSSISFKLIESTFPTVLDSQEFLKIATPSIDSNPTPFVEGTGKPEYNEKVSVPAGTVVTIGPVTPENGKPVQITITFGKDSNGNTTAEVATTQRPDLTPGGSEAPNTKPDPDPAPNPDGNPDKKPDDKPDPDGNPDKRPDDKPDPNDDPSDKDKRKEDKKEESKGLLCDFFPKILACDEQPEKEEPNLEIPEEHIDLNFTSDNTFSQFGQCPAPVTFQALGAEYKISLEPACNLAAMIRPFIIAMAWLVASFFVSRVVRNNA
ncbi:Neisseria meningitidis TspB protein [Neisseria subflava]|uniref:Neisseria meningitidis TspB protein n=2 Tax=Neisseria subflava TaxID=28449 RepID=A0A9X9R0T1_NEISU|nr:Neisseria meningitidis TspB protein [Neisseria subflava]